MVHTTSAQCLHVQNWQFKLVGSCSNECAGMGVGLCACVRVYGRVVGRGDVKKRKTRDVIYVCAGFIPSSFYHEMSLGR